MTDIKPGHNLTPGQRDLKPGQKFGKLTLISQVGNVNDYKAYIFQCECGAKKVFAGSLVRNGRQRSCGCARQKQKLSFKSRRLDLLKARVQQTKGIRQLTTKLTVLSDIFRIAGRTV